MAQHRPACGLDISQRNLQSLFAHGADIRVKTRYFREPCK
jgi:hypothetical protein